MDEQRLAGKVAVVTGAASGIGKAIALRFGAEGARVVAADLDAEGLNKTVEQMRDTGSEASAVSSDVSDPDGCKRIVQAAVERYGALHIVANIAGYSSADDTQLLTTPLEIFERTLAINVKAHFLLSREAVPEMAKAGGGAIINMSSGAARGGSGGVAYSTSKGGVEALTRVIAFQHAADGIRCNAMTPGAVDTPMMRRSMQKLGRPIPKNLVAAEDVAGLATFLASDEAKSVSGKVYDMGGALAG